MKMICFQKLELEIITVMLVSAMNSWSISWDEDTDDVLQWRLLSTLLQIPPSGRPLNCAFFVNPR